MSGFITQQFAPGWNHAGLLLPFYALNPPLFGDYQREIAQKWTGYTGIALNGNRQSKTWGAKGATLTFGKLTRAEVAYLITLKGMCTLYCRNEDLNVFANHNGTLLQITAGNFNKSGNMYENVAAEFIDLVQI